tara:strand:- start:1915 stop:2244 length:330 start_codon:yes stop_codon:yes gene_type:complete
MGFTDKMCYEVATDIINNIFWIKFQPTIQNNLYWYDNLNNFLVTEWDRLQNTNDTQDQFDDNEQHMIIQDAMNLLLDKLNVDSDDFEDHEQDVDWMKFDDIIGYYLCYV